jgi:hypothetical protein
MVENSEIVSGNFNLKSVFVESIPGSLMMYVNAFRELS